MKSFIVWVLFSLVVWFCAGPFVSFGHDTIQFHWNIIGIIVAAWLCSLFDK